MNDWLENRFESDSYEEASNDVEVVQQVIEQVIEGQHDQNESEED